MTTTIDARFAPATDVRPSGRLRRLAAMARAEIKLLVRNRTALATGTLMGPSLALFVVFMAGPEASAEFATLVVGITLGVCALMTLYYNLTSIFVARRESGVFKRFSTGEATPWEALIAAAAPSVVIMAAQLGLATAAAFVGLGVPPLTNPVLALAGIVGIVIVAVALAACSTAFTRSVESAQYTILPIFMVLFVLSGTSLPLALLPEIVGTIASYTPLHAATELVVTGLDGRNMAGADAGGFLGSFAFSWHPLAVLAAWIVITIALAQRFMRFEPRR